MTVYTDNAAAFATRPDEAVDAERHAATRSAVALIKEGKPGRALFDLVRSVERQARMSGIRLTDHGSAA